jgi:hypothetical protein
MIFDLTCTILGAHTHFENLSVTTAHFPVILMLSKDRPDCD